MAYAFTGTNYISIGTVSAFDLGLSAQPFSLAFRCFRHATGDLLLMGKGGGVSNWNSTNGHQWVAAVVSGSGFYWQIYNGTAGAPSNIVGTEPSVGSWFSCVVSYNGSTTTLYLNGNSAGTSSATYIQPSSANRAWIGNITSGESNNQRTLAEVAVWKAAALSSFDVAAFHAGHTPDQIRPQSLAFYAPLVRDLSELRNANTLTNNSATVATHPRIIT